MNEEQAVLDFFAQPENLPLALSVAEQTDVLREQLNNRFWRDLSEHLRCYFQQQNLPWQLTLTEDRNAPDYFVGLHGIPDTPADLYLHPVLEQQSLGNRLQIYFGLMWNRAPSPQHLTLPAVQTLHTHLAQAHYKHNENFMAWQWVNWHPRSSSFLLSYTQKPENIFQEAEKLLGKLLLTQRDAILAANDALRDAPRSATISLAQLHTKRAAAEPH